MIKYIVTHPDDYEYEYDDFIHAETEYKHMIEKDDRWMLMSHVTNTEV